jgi:NAD(P)-dependent dehydrogenase (short-subunit alcohol dehydrogenase family)
LKEHGRRLDRRCLEDAVEQRFSGKLALVSGGTGGLGRAVTLAFLAEGARVAVPYFDEKEFADLKASAQEHVARLEGQKVDVTDEAAVHAFVDGHVTKHDTVDVLVNTVGGYAGGLKLWEMDAKVFDRMLQLNLRSGFALSRAVVPAMLKQRHGAIVNVAAKAAVDHAAGASAYASSKAAAVALMDSLAADLKGTGVRVNSILPSIIDTKANREAMPAADFAAWPKPEEIARVILFLCSDDATVVHGAALPVYGNS